MRPFAATDHNKEPMTDSANPLSLNALDEMIDAIDAADTGPRMWWISPKVAAYLRLASLCDRHGWPWPSKSTRRYVSACGERLVARLQLGIEERLRQ
jgi:hypothetical protein